MDRVKLEREQASAGRGTVQRLDDAGAVVDARATTAQLAAQQARADASPRVAQLHEMADIADTATVQRNDTGMPDSLKAGIESLSGMDMSAVRVHRNSDKPAQLNAHAYAQGADIHLAPGQEQHLPHEAWHVVQQMQGRVQPTAQLKAGAVNDAPSLEGEADIMGAKAEKFNSSNVGRPGVVQAHARAVTHAPGVTAQFTGHRPAVGMTIRYNGADWNVHASAPNNDEITITRGSETDHINWRTADFTIIRVNNQNDHDLRQGAQAYDADGVFMSRREGQILAQYARARTQALAMIKNVAYPHVNQANRTALNAITLDSFTISQVGRTLVGPSSSQPAEWQLTWQEGNRRTWKFVIDVDDPEAESHQEPHVGWEVSAEAGTQAAVARTLGHVWLDYVPTSRGAF